MYTHGMKIFILLRLLYFTQRRKDFFATFTFDLATLRLKKILMSTLTQTRYDAVKYKTPTGNKLSCKGWIQEAALRMLLNNLDPEVAERPDDLIVYGGRGKAARNFEALDNI